MESFLTQKAPENEWLEASNSFQDSAYFSGANEANDMLILGTVYITSESSVIYGDTKPPPSNSGKVKVFIPGITDHQGQNVQKSTRFGLLRVMGPPFINGRVHKW